MSKVKTEKSNRQHTEDARALWVKAIEHMIENEELKERIEFLERKIALQAFAGRSVH